MNACESPYISVKTSIKTYLSVIDLLGLGLSLVSRVVDDRQNVFLHKVTPVRARAWHHFFLTGHCGAFEPPRRIAAPQPADD